MRVEDIGSAGWFSMIMIMMMVGKASDNRQMDG
jgi:hypothetical protein